MNRMLVLLGVAALVGAACLGAGCKPGEPLAGFTATPTTGEAPLTVQFWDASRIEKASKITSWTWDFGDGNSSSESNPVHTYTEAGWFTVSLTVVSTDGKTNTSIQRDFVTVTLKALPLEEAVNSLVTEGTDPLETADEFFASFTELSNEIGHEAAHEAMLAAMEAYVAAGGDYDDFTMRSREIPPHEYGQEAVEKRRMARAYAKANGIQTLDEAFSRMEGAGLLSAEKTDKAGFSTGKRNNVIFVNGINTSYLECVADLNALYAKISPLAGTYQIQCSAVYNPDNILSLAECTVQKIQELTERMQQTAWDSATTQTIHGSITAKTNAGNHVTMVPHSQGNFHVREAVLLTGDSDRGRTSVIETGSPVTSMPEGLRNHSRVDVEGDCVTSFSRVANNPFPYEGTWGWGSWLLSRFGRIAEAVVTCLNSHSFSGSYLQGQAGNEIYGRVRDYAVLPPAVSSFSVNGTESSTTTRSVTLNNTCTGSPAEYWASESASFTGAVWQAYSTAPSFTLSSGNGTKTVYFQVRNSAGTSTASSDTITLNESTVTAPAVSSFSINGGASSTTTRNVTLNNTCTGSPVEYRASESSGFTGAAWLPYSSAPSFTLSSGNGTKTVYFQVRNSAGTPAAVSDTITLNESPGGDTVTILLPGNVPLELVRIPAGSFQMGSPDTERSRDSDEGPVHIVTIGYDFYMGKYEVTQGQWLAVMTTSPGSGSYAWNQGSGSNYPAYYVSWDDAQAFITALNAHITATGQGPAMVRLPSESEWEYACRAGTQTRFYFGDSLGVEDLWDDDGVRSQYMWYRGNNTPEGSELVGGLLPNGFGLHDMSGSVWEWCEDWWHSNYTGAPTDGSAWVSPTARNRVIRGGYWDDYALCCRSAHRDFSYPPFQHLGIGFRLVSVR